jgi:hypothetical protein
MMMAKCWYLLSHTNGTLSCFEFYFLSHRKRPISEKTKEETKVAIAAYIPVVQLLVVVQGYLMVDYPLTPNTQTQLCTREGDEQHAGRSILTNNQFNQIKLR